MNTKSFAAVAVLLAGCAAAPPAPATLGAAELQALVVGNTLSGSTLQRAQFALYFRPDGTAAGELAGVAAVGAWRLTPAGQLCTRFPAWDHSVWAGGREVCHGFRRTDGGYSFAEGAEPAGVVTQVVSGNPRSL